MYRWARTIWRSGLFPKPVRNLVSPLISRAVNRIAPISIAVSNPKPPPQKGPLLVSGLFDDSHGIGRAGRLTLGALQDAGYEPLAHSISPFFKPESYTPGALPCKQNNGVWIMHCNAPEAMYAITHLNPETWRHRYRIGYWAWELPIAPPHWKRAEKLFHEIWTPSEFTKKAFDGLKIPVRVMPHSLGLGPAEAGAHRKEVKNGVLRCLAMGDLRSSAWRKNLMGSIDAYKLAIREPRSDVELLLKIQSAPIKETGHAEVLAACDSRPDIKVVDERLTDDAILQLIDTSDIFLSLHRSEGFGLSLAEAMHMGIPVIATGWSGNMDFMSELPELLVPYEMTAVNDPARVYNSKTANWADPDLIAAADILQKLIASKAMRQAMGLRCQQAVAKLDHNWTAKSLGAMDWNKFLDPTAKDRSSINGS